MSEREESSRIHSRKALDRVEEILEKYPSGIQDVSSVNEESRAWLEKKIQQLRECLKYVKFSSKPSWWETLRLTRNKTAHQKEDFSDEDFSSLCGLTVLPKQGIKTSSSYVPNVKILGSSLLFEDHTRWTGTGTFFTYSTLSVCELLSNNVEKKVEGNVTRFKIMNFKKYEWCHLAAMRESKNDVECVRFNGASKTRNKNMQSVLSPQLQCLDEKGCLRQIFFSKKPLMNLKKCRKMQWHLTRRGELF